MQSKISDKVIYKLVEYELKTRIDLSTITGQMLKLIIYHIKKVN